jgi:hypothetical protein
MLGRVDIDELRHALGGVVLEAAYLERVLRTAFSALVGSKYAAVVDGRLTAAALIEDCERITRYRSDIPAPAKEPVQGRAQVLSRCEQEAQPGHPRHLGHPARQRDGDVAGGPGVT